MTPHSLLVNIYGITNTLLCNIFFHRVLMLNWPSISIITSTLNPNLTIFEQSLQSVQAQIYRGQIEHLILDGGSSDSVIDLARYYKCRVFQFQNTKLEGGSRLSYGLKHVRGTLILLLQSDNIMTSPDWLLRMVEPFCEQNVFCTYSAYNSYEKNMDRLTRYFALIGSPDPTLYYLKKSDKIPITQIHYDRGRITKEKERYYVIKFSRETLPTVGDNGYLVRTEVLRKVNNAIRSYVHVDAFMELLEMGFDTYGVVNNSIIHVSRPNILDQVRRRVEVKRVFTDEKRGDRRYLVFNWQSKRDRWNLFTYIFFSLTFIQPLMVSVRGYLKIRDSAWFLHPVMCFFMVMAYGWSEVVFQLKRFFNRLRL